MCMHDACTSASWRKTVNWLPLRRLLLLLVVAVPGAATPAAPVALHQGVAHVRHRLPGAERDEAYPGVDVVGVGLSREPDGRHVARHERRDAHARGAQIHGGGACVLGVALREVVDGGADGRHGAQGARARLPQLRRQQRARSKALGGSK